MKRSALKAAFPYTIPVMTGYLVLGISYGVLITASGFPFWMPILTSIAIFAGSMEFVLVNLLLDGFHLLQAFLMTLMINARHLFYGISMVEGYRGMGKKKPYAIFALTDETYSLVCQDDHPTQEERHQYAFRVSVLNQIWWVAGSMIGSLLGEIIPFDVTGIDFALTALFLTVFIEQWLSTKDHASAAIGVAASVLCLLVFGPDRFLIPAMLSILIALTVLRRMRKEDTHE